MSINEYLKELISDQAISDSQHREMQNDREKYLKLVNDIESLKSPTPYWGGSYGKQTMIRDSYDMDLLLYFPPDEQKNLTDIYFEVKKHIQKAEPSLFQKNVALRINKREGYHIDIVTAKRSDADGDNAWIYKSREDAPLRTSVKKHIQVISDFQRRDILKLMKLWKIRNNLDIPSFLIELISIRVIDDTTISIEDGLKKIFRFLESSIETLNVPDPANNANNIASVAEPNQKRKCKEIANWSLSQNLNSVEGWKKVFSKKQSNHNYSSNSNPSQERRKPRLSPDSPGTRFA